MWGLFPVSSLDAIRNQNSSSGCLVVRGLRTLSGSGCGDSPRLWPIVVQFCLWQWNGAGSWMGVPCCGLYKCFSFTKGIWRHSILFSARLLWSLANTCENSQKKRGLQWSYFGTIFACQMFITWLVVRLACATCRTIIQVHQHFPPAFRCAFLGRLCCLQVLAARSRPSTNGAVCKGNFPDLHGLPKSCPVVIFLCWLFFAPFECHLRSLATDSNTHFVVSTWAKCSIFWKTKRNGSMVSVLSRLGGLT